MESKSTSFLSCIVETLSDAAATQLEWFEDIYWIYLSFAGTPGNDNHVHPHHSISMIYYS